MTGRAGFQFGDFLLIPRERLLLRDSEPVPLTGKPFDLLLALLRRSGQLVSKDELLQEVWPGRFVEEGNLSVNISAVRKALGSGGAPFIQTVSKRGYRFVAPVAVVEPADLATSTSELRASPSNSLSRTPKLALGPGAARAISADPDAYRAYLEGRYAWSQRSEAGLQKAIDSFRRAVSPDPGFHYYYSRQYNEAIKQLQSVLAMNPNFAPAHLWLGRSYQQIGRFDDALSEFRRVEQDNPEWPVAIAARGSVEGAAGRPEKAKAVLTKLQEIATRRFVTAYRAALVHAAMRFAETSANGQDAPIPVIRMRRGTGQTNP